jgi:hypothetical protein
MMKQELKDQSLELLIKKEKSLKLFIGMFIPIIVLLFFFVIKDYLDGKEMDFAMVTIAICSLGGPATLLPELKKIQQEIKVRK